MVTAPVCSSIHDPLATPIPLASSAVCNVEPWKCFEFCSYSTEYAEKLLVQFICEILTRQKGTAQSAFLPYALVGKGQALQNCQAWGGAQL